MLNQKQDPDNQINLGGSDTAKVNAFPTVRPTAYNHLDSLHSTASPFRTITTRKMEEVPLLKTLVEYLPLESTLHLPILSKDTETNDALIGSLDTLIYKDIDGTVIPYTDFVQKALLHSEIFSRVYLVKLDNQALTDELVDGMFDKIQLVSNLTSPLKTLDDMDSADVYAAIEPFCYRTETESQQHIHPSRVHKIMSHTLVDLHNCMYDQPGRYIHPIIHHYCQLQEMEEIFTRDFKSNVIVNHELTGLGKNIAKGGFSKISSALRSLETVGYMATDIEKENIKFISRSLGNHVSIRDAAIERFCMSIAYPKEFVTGISASGSFSNASDGVRRALADKVLSYQKRQLEPLLAWLLADIATLVGVELDIDFPSTIQLSRIEEMEHRKMELELRKLELEVEQMEQSAVPRASERRFVS